jgi:hypothetical protein
MGNGIRETEAKHYIQLIGLDLAFNAGAVSTSLPKNTDITIYYFCYRGNATTRN